LNSFRYLKTGLVASVFSVVLGCSEPPVPPEVQQATSQEQDLWRTGAPVFAPEQYRAYLAALTSSRELLTHEQSRLLWFRDYEKVAEAFGRVLVQGETVLISARAGKAAQQSAIDEQVTLLRLKVRRLRDLSGNVKDRRLAARRLMKAQVLADEAAGLARSEKYDAARSRIAQAVAEVNGVVKAIKPLVSRFADRDQILYWRRLFNEALAASKRSGGQLIVVSKLDGELTLYRSGRVVHRYAAGLGFNFLSDKLYSGDRATPEGNYKIVKKLPASKYFRGLLLDYPNEEDRRRFSRAKREGLLPANARIGGLIEIHGGGKDGMTFGCVALEDKQMQELYDLVQVGTPVVIVGATEFDNVVSSFLKQLE